MVILSIGTNIGNRLENIQTAIDLLKSKVIIVEISKIYETCSLLKDNQQNYYNLAILCKTDLIPLELLDFIKLIETKMGRVVTKKWGERIIDIDIIDYNNLIIELEKLVLPHPEMHKRSFVLLPILEIFENYKHPKYNKLVTQLVDELEDMLSIKPIN